MSLLCGWSRYGCSGTVLTSQAHLACLHGAHKQASYQVSSLRRRKPATSAACAALIGPRVRAVQVRGELLTSDGRPLAAVSRPCLVPYRSPLVRFCRCARSPGPPRRCACQLCTATAMALGAPRLSMCLPALHRRCAGPERWKIEHVLAGFAPPLRFSSAPKLSMCLPAVHRRCAGPFCFRAEHGWHARMLWRAPLELLGLDNERQVMRLPLFLGYRELRDAPFATFRATLQACSPALGCALRRLLRPASGGKIDFARGQLCGALSGPRSALLLGGIRHGLRSEAMRTAACVSWWKEC